MKLKRALLLLLSICLIVSVSGCQSIQTLSDPIEIPELDSVRPEFPIDGMYPTPKTEADLLHNYLLLDTYNANLESYTDGLERYILMLKQTFMADLK